MSWELTGNSGIDPANDFLGTTDKQPLAIRVNSKEVMRIDPDGEIGIGTTQPDAMLHIMGQGVDSTKPHIHIQGESKIIAGPFEKSPAILRLTSGTLSVPIFEQGRPPKTKTLPGRTWDIMTDGNGLHFSTPEVVEVMTLTVEGKVGIGTSQPVSNLHVVGANAQAVIAATDRNGNQGNGIALWSGFAGATNQPALLWSSGSDLRIGGGITDFGTGSGFAEYMRISADGYVGIGTTTPSAKLTVDPQGAGGIVIGNPRTAQGGFTSLLLEISAESGGFATIQAIRSSGTAWGDLALNPNGGYVGMGTTTPSSNLHVNVPGSVYPINAFALDVQSFGTPGNASNSYFLQVRDILAAPPHGFTHFCIRGDGHVGIGTASPQVSLDVSGDVAVAGDVILRGADCAEEFDVEESAEVGPGTVVVLDQDGILRQSESAYDKRVAGVISGGGNYKPGIILDKQQLLPNRRPVALVGKVYCKVDARYVPIEVGDLLTTSSMAGHAMKVDDPSKALGAVIGKALRPLSTGCGLIPILIALQ